MLCFALFFFFLHLLIFIGWKETAQPCCVSNPCTACVCSLSLTGSIIAFPAPLIPPFPLQIKMCETCQNAEHNKNVTRKARPVRVESPWEVLGLDIHGELGFQVALGAPPCWPGAWQTCCHTHRGKAAAASEEVPRRPQQPPRVQPHPWAWLASLSTHNGSCGRAFFRRTEAPMGVFLLTKVTKNVLAE